MPIILMVRGWPVVCFMYNLQVYVLLDADKEGNSVIVGSEKDILDQVREEYGKEIKGLQFLIHFQKDR